LSKSASALVKIAKLGERAAPIVINVWVGLIELDGAVVKVEGAGVILLGGIGPAEVVVDAGVAGLELQRLIVVVDGEIVFVLLPMGPAAVAIGARLGRIELDRLRVVGDGLIVVALVLVVVPAVGIGDGDIDLGVLGPRDDLVAAGDAAIGLIGGAIGPIFRRFGKGLGDSANGEEE
jgi:hypothetical protein